MNENKILRKTLEVIEIYSMYRIDTDKDMAKIYMWTHTALSPTCRKNHPAWTKDLMKEIKKL